MRKLNLLGFREAHRWPADRYFYVRADITKSDEVDRMLSAVVKRTSRLDIALCHAGMVQAMFPIPGLFERTD